MAWRKAVRITLKVLAGIIGSLLLLCVLVILLIRLPAVQHYITGKAAQYVSGKTHTKVQVGKLFIAFPKSLVIEGVFAEDTKHDTLLYLGKLKVSIDMLGLLHHKVVVNSIYLSDVNANIVRTEVDSTYNFGFLIKAFSSGKAKAPEVKPKTDTSAPWQIQVDKVELANIRGRFADGVSGTTIQGNVGALKLDMKGMNLKKLSFTGHELYLSDAAVSITQSRDNESVKDSTVALLPLLALDKIDLKRIKFTYQNIPHGQLYSFGVGSLFVLPGAVDLNKHTINVKSLRLSGSDGIVSLRRNPVDTTSDRDDADTTKALGWFVNADTINLEHIDFAFEESNVPRKDYGVDYTHLKLTDVNTHIEKGSYSQDRIVASIHSLSLHEKSGFDLKKLSTEGEYNNNGATLKSLIVVTSNSSISKSDLSVSYASIKSLATNIGEMGIKADLQPVQVGVEDILLFVPQLRSQLADMRGEKATVSGKISGKLKDITVNNLTASVGDNTAIELSGHVIGLPKAVTANYDVEIKNANSTKADLLRFLKNKLTSSIDIPESFALSGHVKGSISDAKAIISLKTTAGNVDVDAALKMAAGDTQYTVKLTANALDLGYILKKKDMLGTVTATINAKGQNLTLQTIIADADAEISSVTFQKYTYKGISLEACASSGAYDAWLSIKDTNVQVDLNAAMLWLKDDKRLYANADIKGIDLKKTNLLNKDIRAGAKLDINVRDSSDNINGTANIRNIIVLKAEDSYRIDSIAMVAKSDTGQAHFTLTSDIANVDYDGTAKVQALPKALMTMVNSYFSLAAHKPDTTGIDTSGLAFKLTANINPHPIITDILMPQIKAFNGASLAADFDKDKKKVNVELSASALAYGGIKIDNAGVSIHSVNDSLKYDVTVTHLTTGPVKLTQTELSGSLKNNEISYLLDVKDSVGGDKLKMSGIFDQPDPKSFALHIDSNDLTLNNRLWKLADDNLIKFGAGGLNVKDFKLERYGQSISIASESDATNSPIKIEFKDFDIGTLSQIIEADTALLRGTMNGTAELRNLNASPAFVSDLRIDSIYFQQHAVGNLTVQADNLSANKYQAEIKLYGADNDVQIKGAYYTTAQAGNQLDLRADIRKLNLQSIEPFTAGQIRRSKGYLTGNVSLTGTTAKPLINGEVAFKDASCNVAYINNYITITEDKIRIDPKGIYFNSFDILDSLGQKATIHGAVHTTDFRKMKFDLSIRTDNFTVLNTAIQDNPLFFGHVLLSSKITVRGDESLPVVNADVKLLNSTNVAVVIPSAKVSTDRGDGVVVLVDHSDTTGIMGKKRDSLSTTLQFKGINLIANIDIAKQAYFKVIVDKSSGDSLVVNGEGRLSFSIDASGNMNLLGTYNLSGGSYVFTFEKIIKKRFKIREGSTITWNGQPTDAMVDVSAIYEVRTSAVDLLATELATSTDAEKAAYRKLLRFKVYLNMKGELLKPEISFRLDMNDGDKAALDGVVYSKVNSVNENPEELNKQVFALLILNKFIPTNTVAGDGYGTQATNVARNSVNKILTDQLNNLSGKYIKGVDLNFGLQSNDEYSGTGVQENTQVSIGLKKTFFKDRLGVQVGTSINVPNSNSSAQQYNASNITGDVMIDYKITPDGRYHFKAFRVNQYEGIIDGLLYKTGIGVSYNRDFNRLKEILKKPVVEPEPKTEEKTSE